MNYSSSNVLDGSMAVVEHKTRQLGWRKQNPSILAAVKLMRHI